MLLEWIPAQLRLTDIYKIVGSVTQDINLRKWCFSIVESELLFGLENFAVPHAEIPERITYALETVGIANLRFRDCFSFWWTEAKVAIAAPGTSATSHGVMSQQPWANVVQF